MVHGQAQPEATLQEEVPRDPGPPTADDVLRELRKRQPGNEVIPPASLEGRTAPDPTIKLLPEGTAVVGAMGTIERDGEWWVFVFDRAAIKERFGFEAGTDRVRLLPNSTLDGLVRMAQASATPQPFELSGEATVYRGENYLLPRGALRRPATAAASAAKEQAAQQANSIAVAADASAEDVLEKMKQLEPSRAVRPANAPSAGIMDDEVSSLSAPIFEGTPIVRRTGRLVPQGDWWAFAFDTGHAEHGEQPLRLLPNQSLQFMVDQYERSAAGLVFTVSGEVTEFSGRNYLLGRAVTRRLDLGNLRP